MKKIIILAFCVLLFISSALAAESGDVKENHLSFATGVFSSKLEYGRDISRWELGVGVESGFPNLFIFSLSSDSDDVLTAYGNWGKQRSLPGGDLRHNACGADGQL